MKDADGEAIPAALFFDMAAEGEHEPKEIAARLVAECHEFMDLRMGEPAILFLMRASPKIKAGKWVLGETCLPRFMGGLSPVGAWLLAKACGGTSPDFLMLIDSAWWREADANQRAALIHHELKHIVIATDPEGEKRFDDDGNPQWSLGGHDLEEFRDTVRRFGAWAPDIRPFINAAREGGVT